MKTTICTRSKRCGHLVGFVLMGLIGLCSSGAALANPQRIVEGWYAHNATLLMLGAGHQIVATVARPNTLPWMFELFPELHQAQVLPSPRLNGEQLLTLHPDLVFIPKGNTSVDELRRLGLSVDEEGFDSFQGMLASVNRTAELLGTPLAKQRATAFETALLQQLPSHSSISPPISSAPISFHTGHTGNSPADALRDASTRKEGAVREDQASRQPVRVLHIESISPLQVDGGRTIIDQWIRSAGGINVAHDLVGNKRPVSIEQVLAWQPQVIIIGDTAGSLDTLDQNPLWQQIDAVKQGRVVRNPGGIFPWDRYGPELLLQLEWAHELLSKGKIDQPLMINKIIHFYQQFYGVELNKTDAIRMLKGLPPANS